MFMESAVNEVCQGYREDLPLHCLRGLQDRDRCAYFGGVR